MSFALAFPPHTHTGNSGGQVQAVASALPPAVRRKDKNPARRTFQALRIAVNGELDALSEGLDVLFAGRINRCAAVTISIGAGANYEKSRAWEQK